MGLLAKRRPSLPTTFDRLRDEVDRTLQNWRSGNGEFEELFWRTEWRPSVDISGSDDALEVKVDLPGIRPEDVLVESDNGAITITLLKPAESKAKRIAVKPK